MPVGPSISPTHLVNFYLNQGPTLIRRARYRVPTAQRTSGQLLGWTSSLGDAIHERQGETVMSFRLPSIEVVEITSLRPTASRGS